MKLGAEFNKFVSFAIVWCMVISSFFGMILIVPQVGVSATGDQVFYEDIIIGEGYSRQTLNVTNGSMMMHGNLTIRSGGVVTIDNSSLIFRSDYLLDGTPLANARILTLTIEDGGKLILLNNSTLTVDVQQHQPIPALGVVVRHGASLEATDATLSFPGHLLVDDARMKLVNSTISGLGEGALSLCDPDYFPPLVFHSAPVMLFMSSEITLIRSTIIDSYDNGTANTASDPALTNIFNNHYQFAQDTKQRVYVNYFLERNVNASYTGTATGNALWMTTNDTKNVTVGPGQTLATSGFDVNGLVFESTDIVSLVLNVRYTTDTNFVSGANPNPLYYTPLFAAVPIRASNTTVTQNYQIYDPVSTNKEVTKSEILPRMSAQNLGKLAVNFTNAKNSNVYIDRIWVTVELKLPTYRNVTIGGSTDLVVADSSIDLNNIDQYNGTDATNGAFHKLVAMDQSIANLYGLTVASIGGYNGTSVFKTMNLAKVITANGTSGPLDTTEGQTIKALFASNDGFLYRVNNTQVMEIDTFNTGPINGKIKGLTVSFVYLTVGSPSILNYIQYSIGGSAYKNTTMRIENAGSQTLTGPFDLFSTGVTSIEKLNTLSLRYINQGGVIVYFDRLYLNVIMEPEVALYRWASLNVTDSQDLPVSNVGVTAVTLQTNETAYYMSQTGRVAAPAQDVLEYLGKNASNFNRTGAYGFLMLPLLTDVINQSNAQNGDPLDYNLKLQYRNASGALSVISEESTRFSHFPNLSNNIDSKKLIFPNLKVDKPIFYLTGLAVVPSPMYQNGNGVLNVTVSNRGLTAARNILVSFKDGIDDIGNVTIPTLLANSSQVVSVAWKDVSAGIHLVKAIADPDGNIQVVNRTYSAIGIEVKVWKYLPDLSIVESDIRFSMQPAYTDRPVWINATIWNTGKATAENATISYYLVAEGSKSLIGSTKISVSADVSAVASIVWTPTEIGKNSVTIQVVISDVEEYSYENNQASRNTVVLLATGSHDVILDHSMVLSISGSPAFQLDGNIVVTDNARLIISAGTLRMLLSNPNQYQIVVSENGSVVVTSGSIDATDSMRIYLFDNGALTMSSNSALSGAVTVMMDDHSKVTITQCSSIASDFIAPSTSYANLTATNVTFLRSWSQFGGHATAMLTSISIPTISLQSSAIAWHYRWVTVNVMDGTQVHTIPGAYVELSRYIAGDKYASAMTGADGTARFKVLCDVVTPAGTLYYGQYKVNATYWFNGLPYESNGTLNGNYMPVSLDPYMPPSAISRNDPTPEIAIPDALPELDPPFFASNYNPARGSLVTLSANITNTGVVSAYDVLVRFTDIVGENRTVISDVIIAKLDPILTTNDYRNISVIWTAVYPVGKHQLNVTVDPFEEIPQPDRSNNYAQLNVTVWGVPDLVIESSGITISPTNPVTNSTVSIMASITNLGDNMEHRLVVSFYDTDTYRDNKTLIGNWTMPILRSGFTTTAVMTWENMWAGIHTLTVIVDERNESIDAPTGNHNASIDIMVLDYPNLVATNLQFRASATQSVITQAKIDEQVTIDATITNIGESVASNFIVRFWLGTPMTGTKIADVIVPNVEAGLTVHTTTSWTASVVQGMGKNQSRMVTVEVNAFTHDYDDPIMETTYVDNMFSHSLLVIDDRADLWFPNGVKVKMADGNSTSQAVPGQTVTISFDLANNGTKAAAGALLNIYVLDSMNFRYGLISMSKDLVGGQSIAVEESWIVNLTRTGSYVLVVEVNSPVHKIVESNYTNNIDNQSFTINVASPIFSISTGQAEFQPGQYLLVSGYISNATGNFRLANQNVTIRLMDAGGVIVGNPTPTKTTSTGAIPEGTAVFIPPGRAGTHYVNVSLTSGQSTFYSVPTKISVVEPFKAQSIPMWIFILIAIIVIAVILIFSALLYRYGLSRMVECGECGALIPESSKRCPRCGTDFEVNTAKCSECGTWIPSNAKDCPECGAKFMTEPVEATQEDDYMQSMRKQYDDYNNGFRDQAKAALGKKYSEEKFMDWLKTEPSYLPFEAWLAMQEEGRRSGSISCPSCATLNPKGSTICSKCGTVFEKVDEEQDQGGDQKGDEKPKAFRKIVKRSSERKAVPKKVVKEGSEQPEKSEEQKNE